MSRSQERGTGYQQGLPCASVLINLLDFLRLTWDGQNKGDELWFLEVQFLPKFKTMKVANGTWLNTCFNQS